MLTKIQHSYVQDALVVIREVAQDLEKRKIPLWDSRSMTAETLFGDLSKESIVTGYIGTKCITAMILTTEDRIFWPNIPKGESGFIHKLCVLPNYQGKDISQLMIKYAENWLTEQGINFLHLDCDANRLKLCSLYERSGFQKVDERAIGSYLSAFYEKHLINE